jgi:hypothetical protein
MKIPYVFVHWWGMIKDFPIVAIFVFGILFLYSACAVNVVFGGGNKSSFWVRGYDKKTRSFRLEPVLTPKVILRPVRPGNPKLLLKLGGVVNCKQYGVRGREMGIEKGYSLLYLNCDGEEFEVGIRFTPKNQ